MEFYAIAEKIRSLCDDKDYLYTYNVYTYICTTN